MDALSAAHDARDTRERKRHLVTVSSSPGDTVAAPVSAEHALEHANGVRLSPLRTATRLARGLLKHNANNNSTAPAASAHRRHTAPAHHGHTAPEVPLSKQEGPVAHTMSRSPATRALDPRDLQIAALASLLAWGQWQLGFAVPPSRIVATLGAALLTQALASRVTRLPAPALPVWGMVLPFEPRSALISALSLCLLLRTGAPQWSALAAIIAIGSKFLLRAGHKHVLNPTNGAIVILLALGAPVWVSAGQWGQTALLAVVVAGAGLIVVTRAARADVTLAFLAAWSAVLFGRAAWLGQPWIAPQHQLANGATMLFAFFMISDPRTTPDSRTGRIVFAALVALGAGAVQFLLYRTNGLLWSLSVCTLAVPLIDRWLPGSRYQWSRATSGTLPSGGTHAEPLALRIPLPAGLRRARS